MKKHKAPNRQPRGPRATLPKPVDVRPPPPCGYNPYPEVSSDPWWAHNSHACTCWHQYDECPCSLAAHEASHLAADCPCKFYGER